MKFVYATMHHDLLFTSSQMMLKVKSSSEISFSDDIA